MCYILITVLIYVINCCMTENLCNNEFCICEIDNITNELIVTCSGSDSSILTLNYTLPDSVYSLNLTWNNLGIIRNEDFFTSASLVRLILVKSNVSYIRAETFRFPKLQYLDLSNNNIKYLENDTFKRTPKIEYLNLADNLLTNLGEHIFYYMNNLNELILDNNNLGLCLVETNLFGRYGFGLNNKIENVSLRGINLNRVPDNFFSRDYNIRILDVSKNKLNSTFEIPYTLEYLDLSDNPISEISMDDFLNTPALKHLKLNNLSIIRIPEFTFSPLRGLISLELERNKRLEYFSPLTFGQDVLDDADDFTLQSLSLKESNLNSLDSKLVVPFGMLSKLDLQGNPWKCDCNIVWMKNLRVAIEYRQNLRCGSPKTSVGKNLFNMSFDCGRAGGAEGRGIAPLALISAGVVWALIVAAIIIKWAVPRKQPQYKALCN